MDSTIPIKPASLPRSDLGNANLRLTAQITQRNKLNLFWDEQRTCRSCENSSNRVADSSPEAGSNGDQPIVVRQAAWTSTLSNKVLLEVGIGQYQAHWGGTNRSRIRTPAT